MKSEVLLESNDHMNQNGVIHLIMTSYDKLAGESSATSLSTDLHRRGDPSLKQNRGASTILRMVNYQYCGRGTTIPYLSESMPPTLKGPLPNRSGSPHKLKLSYRQLPALRCVVKDLSSIRVSMSVLQRIYVHKRQHHYLIDLIVPVNGRLHRFEDVPVSDIINYSKGGSNLEGYANLLKEIIKGIGGEYLEENGK